MPISADPVAYWKSVEDEQAKMIARIAGKQQVSLRGPNVDLTLSIKGEKVHQLLRHA